MSLEYFTGFHFQDFKQLGLVMLVGKFMSQTVTFQANNHDNVFFYSTFVWQHYILLKALGIKL